MELDLGVYEGNMKIPAMVDYYYKNPEILKSIGSRVRNKWKLKDDVMMIHDLSKNEFKYFIRFKFISHKYFCCQDVQINCNYRK